MLVNAQTKITQNVEPELYAIINLQADSRLIFTPAEGAAIAELFAHYTVDEGKEGTKQRVINTLYGKTYVHFSCHGSYNWNEPSASGLSLSDGIFTLGELQHNSVVDLSNARLVTLSACETGITDILKGSAEEYVGFPAGFMLAGVPCVVSSLWAVPDLSTALLMERFYRNHLKSGVDIAAALHEAQRWVRDVRIEEVAKQVEQWYRQSPREHKSVLFKWVIHYQCLAHLKPTLRPFAHPYYWAAFTVNGL